MRRAAVLASIRRSLGVSGEERIRAGIVEERLERAPRGVIPVRGQVDAAADAFKVLHQKRQEPGSAVGYVIDHSSLFYLMGPDWRPKAIFPSSMSPAEMAACIDAGLAAETP